MCSCFCRALDKQHVWREWGFIVLAGHLWILTMLSNMCSNIIWFQWKSHIFNMFNLPGNLKIRWTTLPMLSSIPLDASWAVLEASWVILEASRGILGRLQALWGDRRMGSINRPGFLGGPPISFEGIPDDLMASKSLSSKSYPEIKKAERQESISNAVVLSCWRTVADE